MTDPVPALLAGLAVAVAVLLFARPRPRLPEGDPVDPFAPSAGNGGPWSTASSAARRRSRRVLGSAAGVVLVLTLVPHVPAADPAVARLPWLAALPFPAPAGPGAALVLVGLLAAAGSAVLVAQARADRRREATRRRVVEVAESLVGELRAGLPADRALARCVEVWADLAPAAAAARLGADVPGALDRLASRPGADGLARLASAWRVSVRTGSSLADVLDQVAASSRASVATAGLVRSELASARATARLVAGLPVVTLALASGGSSAPWRFLLTTPVGIGCLGAGVLLTLAGLWWIERIAAAVRA